MVVEISSLLLEEHRETDKGRGRKGLTTIMSCGRCSVEICPSGAMISGLSRVNGLNSYPRTATIIVSQHAIERRKCSRVTKHNNQEVHLRIVEYNE